MQQHLTQKRYVSAWFIELDAAVVLNGHSLKPMRFLCHACWPVELADGWPDQKVFLFHTISSPTIRAIKFEIWVFNR